MGKKWILAAVLAGTVGLAAVSLRKGETRAPRRDWPVNVAHRGASAEAPENTLEAFRLAVEAGAGVLEMDLHMTRDGHAVVIHDDTVDRTTDGTGPVREMSLRELRSLDAGYRFSPDGGTTYPYRGRGVRVPTLAEVYAEFPDARVNVEIKEPQPRFEEVVLSVVESAGAQRRTIVASARHPVIKRFRRVSGGGIPTAASRREIEVFYLLALLHLERSLRPPYAVLQVPDNHRGIPVATRRFFAAARNVGVPVDVWAINDPSEMRRLLDLGAQAVMTAHPGTLARLLDGR